MYGSGGAIFFKGEEGGTGTAVDMVFDTSRNMYFRKGGSERIQFNSSGTYFYETLNPGGSRATLDFGVGAGPWRNVAMEGTLSNYNPGSYTDASNNEYARLYWSSNACYLQTTKNGSGSVRPLVLDANEVYLRDEGTNKMLVTASGTYFYDEAYPAASGTTDFGSVLYQWRDGHFSRGVGMHGVTPPTSQPAAISDPSGGATIDAESRTAISAIIDALELHGILETASSGGVSSRGVIGGGYTGTNSNVLDYVNIASTGNATDFGDLTNSRRGVGGLASSTRGVFAGGFAGAGVTAAIEIDYITIASTGNATDFGDLTSALGGSGALSNETRGVIGGGVTTDETDKIDYITIASTGNATDFGDLTRVKQAVAGASSPTRGVLAGGFDNTSQFSDIDYITIASTGNATDFGDLTQSRSHLAGMSSSTRAVFGGGDVSNSAVNTIDYITIASTGNATDFGDLTSSVEDTTGCSNATRGLFCGGRDGSDTNTIQHITIASTGDSVDFGDLTVSRRLSGACSDAHGGLS